LDVCDPLLDCELRLTQLGFLDFANRCFRKVRHEFYLAWPLEPGEPVVLMGPTGTPTQIVGGETVVLAGGGLGNAVLFSIGAALRQAGSRVLYFAGYKRMIDRYKVGDIEAASDVVVWCCDEAPGFKPDRPHDRAYVGNIVEAMRAYAQGDLGAPL